MTFKLVRTVQTELLPCCMVARFNKLLLLVPFILRKNIKKRCRVIEDFCAVL